MYILASEPHGTLYVGVTKDLVRRVWQHREEVIEGFTKEHAVKQLVFYERHENASTAITREKQIKHWKRAWKVKLIMKTNHAWRDLYSDIVM